MRLFASAAESEKKKTSGTSWARSRLGELNEPVRIIPDEFVRASAFGALVRARTSF